MGYHFWRVSDSPKSFLERVVIPLTWFKLGSVRELLELPITELNRLSVIMGDKNMVKKFKQFHSYLDFSENYMKFMGAS